MSNRAKKISELTTANTITDNDYFILVANVAGTLTTRKLTVSTFRDTVTFPHYANSTYAGIVKVGSQLAVDNDGLLSANIQHANTSAFGTVKVGSELAIDQNGFLVANIATATNNHVGVVAVGNNLTINATGYLSANIFVANTTVLGKVGVGDQLVVNATGFLSANLRYANTTSQGVVKVGNNLTINVSGHLSAVLPIANTSSAGMIVVGNTMAIADGVLNVNAAFANTTSPGIIIVGDQLFMDNETYQLSANIRIANTTSAGIIKVGDNMAIDANGFLTANISATITSANVFSAEQLSVNGFTVTVSEDVGRVTIPGDIYLTGTNNHISSLNNTSVEVFSGGIIEIKAEDLNGAFHSSTIGVKTNNSAYINVKSTDYGTMNWKFDKSGNTTFPGHIVFGNSTVNTYINSTSFATASNTGVSLNWANTSVDRYVQVSNTGVVIGVANPTADPSVIIVSSNNIAISAQDSNTGGVWTFKSNGAIQFPDSSLQTTAFKWVDPPTAADSVGIAGQMASDGAFLYYCVGDGDWKRTPLNTW
jgi:hypothetical protein